MRDTRGLADPLTLNKVLEDALGVKLDDLNNVSHSKGKKSKKKGQ